MTAIIEKQTTAKTSGIGLYRASAHSPVTFSATGVLVDEEIAVKVVDEDGSATNYAIGGDNVVLSLTNNSFAVYSPMRLQFVKPSTANAVGVEKLV